MLSLRLNLYSPKVGLFFINNKCCNVNYTIHFLLILLKRAHNIENYHQDILRYSVGPYFHLHCLTRYKLTMISHVILLGQLKGNLSYTC